MPVEHAQQRGRTLQIDSETAMVALGDTLAERLDRWQRAQGGRQVLVTLSGDLGAGKSVLVRSMLRHLGHAGPVKSPTFTLVETYTLNHGRSAAHLDLYRLADPEELDYIGFRDLVADNDWLFIEWPDRGRGYLPDAILAVHIAYPVTASGELSTQRTVTLDAAAPALLHGL